MIKVGIAGIGFMGWIHYLAYQSRTDVQVVAICSRDAGKRAGDWSSIKGNFGPPAGQVDLAGVQVYETLDAMLADPNVDLVDLCTPPAAHLNGIVAAANAGKHVFCEKPLGLTLADCDQAVEICQQQQVQLFVGHVLPFVMCCRFLASTCSHCCCRFLASTCLHCRRCKINAMESCWVVVLNEWSRTPRGCRIFMIPKSSAARYWICMYTTLILFGCCIFEFADAEYCVAASSGVIDQQGRPFNHAYEIHFEEATLQFEFAAFADQPESMPLKVLLADGSVERPELGDGDPVFAFEREVGELVSCLEAGQTSKILDATLARDAIEICQMQAEQIK